LGIVALLLLAAGCSPLHTEVRSSYRWTDVSEIGFEEPASDPWGLIPVVCQELQAMGYALVPPTAASPDLIVRFSTRDGPDFTSDGTLITRPKSLHVQFADPGTNDLVAVADYFLRSSEEPATGMRAALSGLHQEILGSAHPVQARPAATQPVPPAAAQSAPAAAQSTPPAAAPSAQPSAPLAAQPPVAVSPVAAPAPVSRAVPEPAAAPQDRAQHEPPAPADTAVEDEPVIKSREQSPWMPRFKSWGFEEWGKSDEFDR
jgi:hypothetical protein